METRQASKRRRSESEDANNGHPQSKIHVNKIMMERNNANEMKKVHDRTTKMLFDAARNKKRFNHPLALPYEIWKQYAIAGDGTVKVLEVTDDDDKSSLERKPSHCCRRPTLVHGDCANCTMPICEFCGYSCVECGQFVCRACVTALGNKPDDHPLCEVCQMYLI